MGTYKVTATLKHNDGLHKLTVHIVTDTYQDAIFRGINLICTAERCPESAIKQVVVKLMKVNKTKKK